MRRSELSALRWSDYDIKTGTLAVTGKLVRISGRGLQRLDSGTTASANRTVAVPEFAVAT